MRALDAAEARAEWRRLRYEAAGARLQRGLQARGGSDGRGAGDLDAEAERAAEDAILALGDDDFVTLTRGSTGPDETHLRVAADFVRTILPSSAAMETDGTLSGQHRAG